MRPLRWSLAFALLGGAAVWPVATASPAAAHDVLVSTSPTAGAAVDAAPDAVQLTFSEPVLRVGVAVRVTGPAGPVQVGEPQIRGTRVSQALRAGSPAGRYLVRWQVASNDGHPVAGRLTFTVRASRPAATPSASPGGAGSPASTLTTSVSPAATPAVAASSASADDKLAEAGSGTRRTSLFLLLAILGPLGALVLWHRRR